MSRCGCVLGSLWLVSSPRCDCTCAKLLANINSRNGTIIGGRSESFNGKLRDELLNREVFEAILEAQVLIEGWRKEYNQA
jgi:Integrase core domain